MNMYKYFKDSLWDYILCVIISATLSFCIMQGFYLPEKLTGNISVIVLVSMVINLLLFITAYNRNTIKGSILLLITITTICLLLIRRDVWILDGAIEGSSGHSLYYLILFLTVIITFLLSRTRLGAVFVFITGVLIIASVSFLLYGDNNYGLFIFLISSTCLFFYRNYRYQALHISTDSTAFFAFARLTFIICAISISLSFLTYIVVIKPLDPPTRKLQLITKLMSLPIVEKMGVSSKVHIFDPETTSDQSNDEERISDKEGEQEKEKQSDKNENDSENKESEDLKSIKGSSAPTNSARAISYMSKDYRWLIAICSVFILIVMMILSKIWWINKRLLKIKQKEKNIQIISLYNYFLKKLELVGLPSMESDTPIEYSKRLDEKTERFFTDKDDFKKLSQIFEKIYYGNSIPTDTEHELFLKCYSQFSKRCRETLGFNKYLKVFFRL